MGIEIEMTGSGKLGDIAPGWSAQEYATPIIIGENAGGMGSVGFNASAKEDSLFVINNNITTTEESLGHISGVVKSVSQSGISVSISHDNKLSVFDTNKSIPSLDCGGIYSVMDICNQITGRQNLFTAERGTYYSLRGHSNGFKPNGSIANVEYVDGSYVKYNNGTGTYDTYYFTERNGGLNPRAYTVIDNDVWANGLDGDSFSQDKLYLNGRVAFKTLLSEGALPWGGNGTRFGFSSLPTDTNTGAGYYVNLWFDYATSEANIGVAYYPGGIYTEITETVSFASLDKDAEIAVFIDFNLFDSYTDFSISATLCNTSNYSNIVTVSKTVNGAVHAPMMTAWGIDGVVRAVWLDRGVSLPAWVGEYEQQPNYVIDDIITVEPSVPAQQSYNVWEYLQAACAAYSKEIALVNDVLTVRQLGQRVINIDDKTIPTISPNITMSGRSAEIVYTNAIQYSGEFYNAYADGNRILSVKSNETVTTTVSVNGTPKYLTQPVRGNLAQNGVGEYHVISSSGIPVPLDAWRNEGGSVSVKSNESNPNAIDVTIVGPNTSSIFGPSGAVYVEPYKLAYSAGNVDYAALSIIGVGIKTDVKTLKLYSAADPNKIAQDVAKTVTNPFISTVEQAYDAGIWVTENVSGPRINISATIPTSKLNGFGLSAGSLISYRDSIYRITDLVIGNLATSFNASRYVTVGNFDSVWSNYNVNIHDLTWSGFDTSDQVIAPLRLIGDDESLVMLLDSDVNPYYDFGGEPDISVFRDSDSIPYYKDGGNLDGEDEILLDTDANPYDGAL